MDKNPFPHCKLEGKVEPSVNPSVTNYAMDGFKPSSWLCWWLTESAVSDTRVSTSSSVIPNHTIASSSSPDMADYYARPQRRLLHPKRRAAKFGQNDDESSESDASILVDLTKDLKDIALYAGKSSGDLVTSLYHTLCEE